MRFCIHQVSPVCHYFKILAQYNENYYTLHIFLLYKSNKIIQLFFGKFPDEGNKWLSPGLQPLKTGRVLKKKIPVRFRNCSFYTKNYFVVSTKTKFWLTTFDVVLISRQ